MTLSFFTREDRIDSVKFKLLFKITQFHCSETVIDSAGTKEDMVPKLRETGLTEHNKI